MRQNIPAENQLIEAAQQGDTEAFDRLVRQYQDYLYRLMVRACHHPDDAEEVAVEAFARAYERLRQFEGRSSFVTWVSRIASNLCFRRHERKESPSAPLAEQDNLPDRMPGPEEQSIAAEMSRYLHDAVESLPEPDRTVLVMRDIEQMPAADVSERLGLSIPAVKSRLHRARRRLREELNGYFLSA